MNSMLNITIRVAAAQARREIASVASEIKRAQAGGGAGSMGPAASVANRFGLTGKAALGMAGQIDKGYAAMQRFGGALPGILSKMESTGKNMQWVGRQLTFNFTLPLVAAGAMATKWAMQNEAAMVRVRKVYGDGTKSVSEYDKEVAALGKTFEMLSTRFGIAQADVISIGGDWAQVGAQGRTLGEVVRATMEAMTLGEVDATTATKGLITMMAAYSLRAVPEAGKKTSELTMAIANLNAVENATQIDMGGLIGVMQRSASAAQIAGISYQELAAMTSALTPTAGTAAQAGNGMRTMIARLVNPTAAVVKQLRDLNLVTDTNAFFKMNVKDRILAIAKAYNEVDDAQKPVTAGILGGTYQFNKMATLLEDINKEGGNYHRALRAMGLEQNKTGESTDVLATKQQELQRVLSSNPKRFDILKVSIQNSLAKAILPLIPALMQLMTMINGMAQAFANLSPKTQGMIIFGLAFVAIVGPIVQMMGAMILLTKELGGGAMWLGKKLGWVGKQMFSMAQNIWDFLARLLFQQGTISGAWTVGEAERAAATTAANAQIVATTTVAMAEIGAAQAAAAGAGTGAAAISGASWTTAAITAEAGWGMATAAIGSGFMTLGLGAGSWGAATAAAATAAAGTTGQVWIAANATLVAVTTIAGSEIVTVWIGTAGAIVGVWDAMIAHMMGGYTALGTGSAVAAELTAAPWKLQAIEIAVIETAAMSQVAASQALVPAAAAPAAATTTTIWATAGAAIKTAMLTPLLAMKTSVMFLLRGIATGIVATLGPIAAVLGLPLWALVAIIAAVAGAIVLILKTDIETPVWNVIKSIGNAIWALPRVFVSALSALARAVQRMVMTVMRWLSYLNPFQRHSPSLVDNVRAGVATILDEYSRLKAIGPMIKSAAEAHEAFNKAVKASGQDPQQRERADQRQIIAEQAPSVLPSFDAMGVETDRLQSQLPALKAEIDAQAATVARWEASLKSIDATLKAHQDTLSDLEDQLSSVTEEMDKAQSEIDRLGNTDLPGMRAMSDQIFENEMAQKRLRLEIMRMEAAGQSVDDLKDRMAALNGEIDLLRGEREDLRLAGAGSDVLGTYDAEIDALEAQRQALGETGTEIDQLQAQLEELARQGEMLNLEQSINFDPQIRQIDQMIEGLHEMPFDQIVAGIGAQQEKLAALQPIHDSLNAKVEQERATVEAIQKQRDGIADTLDVEQQKLTDLESAYSDIEGLIRDMTSGMTEFAAASKEAAAAKDEFSAFDAAAGGDFEDVTGLGGLGEGGGLPDIEAMNAELQKELEEMMGSFDDMDPFKSMKEKFSGFIDFVKDWGRLIGPIVIGALLGGWPLVIGLIVGIILKWGPSIWGALQTAFGVAVDVVTTVFGAVGGAIGAVWHNVIYPVLAAIGGFLLAVLKPAWEALGAVVSWVWNTVIAPAISFAWGIIKPIFDALWGFINGYLVPIFQLIGTIVAIVFVGMYKIIEAQIKLALLVLNEIWQFINGNLGPVFSWLYENIVKPVFEGIGTAIGFAWNNVIKPVVTALWGFIKDTLGPIFSWLWHSVIEPAMGGIGSVVSFAWNNVISPIFEAMKTGIGFVADKITWLKDNVFVPVWDAITSVVKTAWNTMAGVLEAGINFFIRIFNALADGVEKIAGMIGITVDIKEMKEVDLTMQKGGEIPKLEAGGKMGGWDPGKMGPMVTNGIRAIVGEGSPIHPEFVIPTDPKWRQRAVKLYRALGNKLGRNMDVENTGGRRAVGHFASGGIPAYAAGGVMGIPNPLEVVGGVVREGRDAAGAAWDATGGKVVSGLRKGAVMAAFAPFLAIANNLIGLIPNEKIQTVATKIKNDVYNWAKGEDDKLPSDSPSASSGGSATGLDATFLSAFRRYSAAEGPFSITSGFRSRADQERLYREKPNLAAPPGKSNHERGLAIDHSPNSTIANRQAARNFGLWYPMASDTANAARRVGGKYEPWHVEPLEAGGRIAASAREMLYRGGIVKGSTTGTDVTVGESNQDEAIVPLPRNWDEGFGKKEYHFHGDLSFPNVASGDDAQSFLDNLEALAGSGKGGQ